ncbi:MAG TPA: response regulator [Novosphingobium sp.]
MSDYMKDVYGKRPLILLIEDDNAVRRSLQLLLQGRGFDVKAYADAAALLADPDAGRAGCLLADYRLSISDGISVLETLRARGHETPAILMTAFGSDEVAGRARSAGFVEVLEKPFRDHVLMAALSRATAQPPVPL